MTNILLPLLLITSCKLNPSKERFAGFQGIIDEDKIMAVSGGRNKTITKINLPDPNETPFDYNKMVDNVNFIKLDSGPESMIANIDKLFFGKNRIIVADIKNSETVFIFDSAGRYINKISSTKNGNNGEGSLSHFRDVTYYYNTGEIVLHDDKESTLYYFDSDGKFKREEKEYISFFGFENIKETDKFVYIDLYTQNNHIPILTQSDIYLGDGAARIDYTAPNAVQRIKIKDKYHYGNNLSSNNSKGVMYYTPVFCDTIFIIDAADPDIYPRFIVNYPGKSIVEIVKQNSNIDADQLNKLMNTHQYYSFQGKILSNADSISYFECFKDDLKGYFYSGKTGKIIGGNILATSTKSDSTKFEAFQFPFATCGEQFVSILSPKEMLASKNDLRSNVLQQTISGLTLNDNPILAFYTLKPF